MRQHQLLDDMSRWFMDVASGMPGHDAAMAVEAYPWMKREKRILEEVLRPYVAWAKKNRTISGETGEERERIHDEIVRIGLRTERHKRENIRKRAKVSLVHDVLPLIGRILHAVDSMKAHGTGAGTLDYVEELADEITDVLSEDAIPVSGDSSGDGSGGSAGDNHRSGLSDQQCSGRGLCDDPQRPGTGRGRLYPNGRNVAGDGL